jgi:hypothetical protein
MFLKLGVRWRVLFGLGNPGGAGRISRAQSAADFGDGEGWRKGEVSAKSIGKVAFPVVVCPREAKLPPGAAGKPVEQNRSGTLHSEAVGFTGGLESETQNGNFGLDKRRSL